eukprot:NODE_713_length_4517_cov_0.967180.p4 type:complete len:161 gc:universal NODE_713_length_4517_cov_0.967180:645-1127(+)
MIFGSYFNALRKYSIRQYLHQFLAINIMVASALYVWKGLGVLANTHSPIVVVLTGSMEPAIHRGDILFITNHTNTPRIGDVVVYTGYMQQDEKLAIPIIHRALQIFYKQENGKNETYIVTKGDNNPVDDRGLYLPGQHFIKRSEMLGYCKGNIPRKFSLM